MSDISHPSWAAYEALERALDGANDTINTQAIEIARLRYIIGEAPHASGCLLHTYQKPCDCWKSRIDSERAND